MKVLHLPANLASQMRVTVLAQRETGLEVRGLTGPSPVQNAAGLEVLPHAAPGASFLRRKATALRRAVRIMEAIAWADIVHWHYSAALPGAADLRAAQLLGRKRFVEFWGSDIRNPEIEFADNPHFVRSWDSGAYECREYIRELGGQVEVTSAVSRGSTFYIRLPLRAAATKAANLSVQGAQG